MNPQYIIHSVGDLAFEREVGLIRGTEYSCERCKKRMCVKGVLGELTGDERKKHRTTFNSYRARHSRACRPSEEVEVAENEAVSGQGCKNDDHGEECEAIGKFNAAGDGAADEGNKSEDEAIDEHAILPPPPLDPVKIQQWRKHEVIASFGAFDTIPAEITSMRLLPPAIGQNGLLRKIPIVRCTLHNEHGGVEMDLPSTVIFRVPKFREKYTEAEVHWQKMKILHEYQSLLQMFEKAFLKSPTALHAALDSLLQD